MKFRISPLRCIMLKFVIPPEKDHVLAICIPQTDCLRPVGIPCEICACDIFRRRVHQEEKQFIIEQYSHAIYSVDGIRKGGKFNSFFDCVCAFC